MYSKSLPRHLKWSNTISTFSVEASQDDVPPAEAEEEEEALEGLREMCKRVLSSVGLGLRTGSPRTTSKDQVDIAGVEKLVLLLLRGGGDLRPKEAEMA